MYGLRQNVEQLEPGSPRQTVDRAQREREYMPVINGVEFCAGQQLPNVRKFEDCRTAGLEACCHGLQKAVDIGHMGEHVVADDQIGRPKRRSDLVNDVSAKERLEGRDSTLA